MQGRAPCLRPVAASRRWRLSRTEGDLGIRGGLPSRFGPHRPPDQAQHFNKTDPGLRNDKFDCNETKPKEMEQPEKAAT